MYVSLPTQHGQVFNNHRKEARPQGSFSTAMRRESILGKVALHEPVAQSQTLTVLSAAAVMRFLPSEARQAQCNAAAAWPRRVWRQAPDCTHHTMAHPSAATDTAVSPSGLTLILCTLPAWVWSSTGAGACRSHTLAVLSSDPVMANLQAQLSTCVTYLRTLLVEQRGRVLQSPEDKV